MKKIPLILTLLTLGLHTSPAQEGKPAAAPAAEAETPYPASVLENAVSSMANLSSYHVSLEITTPAGKATSEGDLGAGTLSLKGTDAAGVKKERIVVGEKFFLSVDGGKTWKTGDAADRDGTLFLSSVITGPISPDLKVWKQGTFEATEVEEGGETLLKVEKPAKGKEPALTFWLSLEKKFDNAVFVRKAAVSLDTEAGFLPVTVTYTKFDEPVEIKAPPAN